MNLFTIDLVAINNDSIIIRGTRNDFTRYTVIITRFNNQNNNHINNINIFSFYNPNSRTFYSAELIDNNIFENMNNRIIHSYVWTDLHNITNLNFNYELYGIPHQLFIYIKGLIIS